MDKVRLWKSTEDARELARQGIEVWCISPDASHYYVSNLGRVKRIKDGFILKGGESNSGYVSVTVELNSGIRASKLVHRLVVRAFDGPPPTEEHKDVRHGVDGPTDNRLFNLCWGTRSENMLDVKRHRLLQIENKRVEIPTKFKQYEWYNEHTAVLVEKALALYDAKKLTREDVATMVGCTVDVAANLITGRANIGQKLPSRSVEGNGRVGENHYRAVCTDEELEQALKLYVENHWSGVQFADHLGIKQISAHAILSGSNRTNVTRPEGFEYPWPDARSMNALQGDAHGCAKLTEAHILEVFRRIEQGEFKDMKEVQAALGSDKGQTYGIVGGRSWSHLPRSQALLDRVAQMQRSLLSPETQQAVLRDLLAGVNRNVVKEKYGLSDTKIASYVTKANKLKGETVR
jgi:hypothetical protein